MLVEFFDATTAEIHDAGELRQRMQRPHEGTYDAFSLQGGNGTSFDVLINGTFAFLFFFSDHEGKLPSYQAVDMTPPSCPDTVRVLQTGGWEADGFDIPAEHLVDLQVAIDAAVEYFETQALPTSITWFEL